MMDEKQLVLENLLPSLIRIDKSLFANKTSKVSKQDSIKIHLYSEDPNGSKTLTSSKYDNLDQFNLTEPVQDRDHNQQYGSARSNSFSTVSAAETTDLESSSSGTLKKQKDSDKILLDPRCFVSKDQWITHKPRKSCNVCLRNFGVLRKKHSCRMCGEVICGRCSVFKPVDLPIVMNKLRICSCCFYSYRKKSSIETITASNTFSTSIPKELISSKINIQQENSMISTEISTVSREGSIDQEINMGNIRLTSEELEALEKARELEREVQSSRKRIQELEKRMKEQECQQNLSSEQQNELIEARKLIDELQDKLHQQEESVSRQSMIISSGRYRSGSKSVELEAATRQTVIENADSAALQKKLRILERQLQQAGIHIPEIIPYEVAKEKVEQISRRLQEIGRSEIVLEDKNLQAQVRKEYYILEQEMEKYNSALIITDEFIENERRKAEEWERVNHEENLKCLTLLRKSIPVNISVLSEKQLLALTSPSGKSFPKELVRRLKRTNILQLIRIDPLDITKMHPSVIESYRSAGLGLIERRALHEVLKIPFKVWEKQQKEALNQKKFIWCKKLQETLRSAIRQYENHCGSTTEDINTHKCDLVGTSCPVRAEEKNAQLYMNDLGFPDDEQYFNQDIIKSDPDGAGRKALLEAQAHAKEVVSNQRQRELKAHYKMNVRAIAIAHGVLDEMEITLDQLRNLEENFGEKFLQKRVDAVSEKLLLDAALPLLETARNVMFLMAKRSGMCMTGKRDISKDDDDTRSSVEVRLSADILTYISQLIEDVCQRQATASNPHAVRTVAGINTIKELMKDLAKKNEKAMKFMQIIPVPSRIKRVSWKELEQRSPPGSHSNQTVSPSTCEKHPVLPHSAPLFEAIKARRKSISNIEAHPQRSADPCSSTFPSKPNDLLSAIKARKAKSTVAG